MEYKEMPSFGNSIHILIKHLKEFMYVSVQPFFFSNCILSPLGKCGWRTGARKVTDSIHLETHMAKSAATIRLKPTVGDREARQRTAQPAQCHPKAPGTSDSFTSDYTTLFSFQP